MPLSGDRRRSPIGSRSSSGRVSISRASGTNWRAMGSLSSPRSISSAMSGVIATAKRSTTAATAAARSGATSPAATSSDGRRSVRPPTSPSRCAGPSLSAPGGGEGRGEAGRALNIRVDMRLGLGAGMGHGALLGVADGLRVFPQGARLVVVPARLPFLAARRQLGIAELDTERAGLGVQGDDVAVAQQPDRTADRRLGSDMADAEAAGGAGAATVGDERHLLAHALAVNGRGGREHLAHAGAAARSLVADDDDLARLVVLL